MTYLADVSLEYNLGIPQQAITIDDYNEEFKLYNYSLFITDLTQSTFH